MVNRNYTTLVDNDFYTDDWMSLDYEQETNLGSSFWSDTIKKEFDAYELVTLSKYLKAVSNFVKILTNKDNINVSFASDSQSYTDGKNIVISKDITDKNFDSVVGLALHESSHILKTDMTFFKNMNNNIKANDTVVQKLMKKYNVSNPNQIKGFIFSKVRDLVNMIEDRRIDDFTYKSAPGYMIYYRALYSKYFLTDEVNQVLNSDSFSNENWNSYLYRTLFVMNSNSVPNQHKLKNLEQIYNLIDLKNISRLKSVKDSYKLALEIFTIIENSISPEYLEEKEQKSDKLQMGDSLGSGMSGDSDNNEKEKSDSSEEMDKQETSSSEKSKEDSSDNSDSLNDDNSGNFNPKEDYSNVNKTEKVSDSDLSDDMKKLSKEIQKSLENVRKLINNTLEKEKLSSSEQDQMKILEKANVTFQEVGDTSTVRKRKCIFVKKFTQELINGRMFSNIITKDSYNIEKNQRSILDGIKMGVMLGKQLKVRNERKELKFSRLNNGKIDSNIIHELGFKDNGVFYKKVIDKYNDVFIHITVDASGSMSGDKWYNSLKTVVSICKAVSMISGIRVSVSFRNTSYLNGNEVPFILMGYDSKVDKFTKITSLFKYLTPGNCTPEGLTFETLTDIFPTDNNIDKYFLNFSDGMPYCSDFDGYRAINYTKSQVKKLISQNIDVISYFISDSFYSEESRTLTDFRTMYGKNSQNIDTNSVIKVAKSLNDKFLTKKENN